MNVVKVDLVVRENIEELKPFSRKREKGWDEGSSASKYFVFPEQLRNKPNKHYSLQNRPHPNPLPQAGEGAKTAERSIVEEYVGRVQPAPRESETPEQRRFHPLYEKNN